MLNTSTYSYWKNTMEKVQRKKTHIFIRVRIGEETFYPHASISIVARRGKYPMSLTLMYERRPNLSSQEGSSLFVFNATHVLLK